MFVVLLLLNLALAQDPQCTNTKDFVLTAADATKDIYNNWEWDSGYGNYCTLQPGETYEFSVDLSNLEGTSSDGRVVTIEGEEGVDLTLTSISTSTSSAPGSTQDLDNFEVSGFFDEEDKQYNWIDEREFTECDFSKKRHTFRIRNTASYVEYVGVRIEVQNEHGYCELAEAVRKWLTAVLILLGVCCGIGILICVLIACGCIACCNQNKTTHVHHTTVQTVPVVQPEMTPAQPNYSGPPGGSQPDMTQYSSGLQPGWEAKWDPATNRPYWVDHSTQQSVWEDPRTNMGSV